MAGNGLRLARSQGGEGYSGNLTEFSISPSNTGAIYTGDIVLLGSNGFIDEASGRSSSNDFSTTGVFMGVRYQGSDGSYVFRNYWDGGVGRSNIVASVALPINGLFYIKGTAGQTYTQADIGTRKGIVYAAGNAQYGDSRISLGAAGATVATGPLYVHRLAPLPGNTFASAEPVFEVSVVRSAASAIDAA